eukprot:11190096-Lingulodinium_polyedra.AAC.1
MLRMLDANARVGSHCSAATGSHHAETETGAWSHLRRFCEAFALQIPQTSSTFMSGGQAFTWLSKRGHSARIDYVLWPQSAQLVAGGT